MIIHKNKNSNTKKISIIIVATVLLLITVLLVLEKTRVTNIIHDPFYHAPESSTSVVDTLTRNDPSTSKDKGATLGTTKDSPDSTSDVPVSQAATISISSLGTNQDFVSYSATVSGSASANGTCTITFEQSGAKPVVATSTAKGMTCVDSSIPVQQFTMLGTWTATLRYFYDNQQISTTGKVVIQ